MHRHLPCLLTALALLCGASAARAQGIGFPGNRFSTTPAVNPLSRPVVSPYVNLLRNNSPLLNYYGLVRPEVEFRDEDNRLQGGIQELDDRLRRQGQSTPSLLGASGHSARFMTDLRGRSEGVAIEMQGRRLQRAEQQRRFGRATPETGHSSYFGNNGYFYSTVR